MIDAEHAGTIGYSFDGFNSLAMSGARIDPEHYLAQCPTPDATTEAILSDVSAFNCGPARQWDSFTAHAGESITVSEDGLWQPLTDRRIRAVMPMAGEGWWLFGERGLAAVDRPILIIVATEDELYKENALIYEHLGTSDRTLISFVGITHGGMLNAPYPERMAHFAVAFFGYHLQGREDYAEYVSEEFVKQHDDLAWGVYEVTVRAAQHSVQPTSGILHVFKLFAWLEATGSVKMALSRPTHQRVTQTIRQWTPITI